MSADSQTIPNTGLVTFAKFDITAGSEDAAISSIQLERQGLSNRSDINRVYFEQNSKRVSSRGSVNIDEEVLVSFTPAMVVKAGTTETIDLVVELKEGSDIGAEHRFAIVDVESSTDVANNLPIVTNTMKLGSYKVESVTFDPLNTTSTTKINVGDNDIVIGEFELETKGDKDNLFKSVTFRNNGGADMAAVFDNIGLYNNGNNVATDIMIDGRDITFVVNHEIENGRTENYEIRADLISTDREGDDFELELRNTTDLNVVELSTGFSAPISLISNEDVMNMYELVGGEIILTRDTDYTNTDTVSSSTNDVVLLAAKLRVDEAVTVEDLELDYTVSGSGMFYQYRDLKLVVDGRTVSTYTPNEDDDISTSGGDFTFDGTFLIENDSSIMVFGNLRNNANNADSFKIENFRLSTKSGESTAKDIRYVSNDERIEEIAGSVNGVKVTVAESTLLITRNDGLNTEKLVSGARDVELFGFSVRANDVSDVKITSLKPKPVYNGTGFTESNVTNVRLYEGSTLLKTENNFDFNSLNLSIPKNGSKSFKIVADFDNSVASGSTLSLNMTGSTHITARNVESNKILKDTNNSIDGTSSTTFSFINEGQILVKANSNTRAASVVAPSSSEVDVFSFDLEAKDDTLRLTDLYVTQSGTDYKAASGVTLDLAEAVRSSSINVDGRTIDGAVISSGTLYFSIGNSNPVVIEKDETVRIDVNLSFNDSNSRKANDSNFQLTVGTAGESVVNGTENGLRLVSQSTGITLKDIDVNNTQSRQHLLARTNVVVDMLNGTQSTQDFKVVADSNRRAGLNTVTVEISGNSLSGAINGLELEKNGEVVATGNLDASGKVTFDFYNYNGSSAYEYISAGEDVTFTIDGLSGLDTAKDNKRFMKIIGITYNDDVTNSIVTIDDTNNRYNNVGIPSNEASFTY